MAARVVGRVTSAPRKGRGGKGGAEGGGGAGESWRLSGGGRGRRERGGLWARLGAIRAGPTVRGADVSWARPGRGRKRRRIKQNKTKN